MSASQALDKTRGRINPPVMTEHGTWHTADATFMSTGRQFSCFRASFSFVQASSCRVYPAAWVWELFSIPPPWKLSHLGSSEAFIMARQLTTPFLSVTHSPAITFSAEPALPVNLGCRCIRKPHLSRPFQIRLTPRGLSCLKTIPALG